MSGRYTLSRKIKSALRFPYGRMAGYPTLVNLEVTKRCNARCDFCDYWKTKTEESLDDYVPVVEKLKPMIVMITGGEPTLRRDLPQIIGSIRAYSDTVYLGMVTNGATLNVERGLKLWESGLDQLAISLDWLDERHDEARGIPKLAAKIKETAPQIAAKGVNVLLNTVIKQDNLDSVVDMVHWCNDNDVKISFSAYTDVKVGNLLHNVQTGRLDTLRSVIDELIQLKKSGMPILSTSYYLRRIPEFFENGGIGDCIAGKRFVTVTPEGNVKRCSEFPAECHYTEWTPNTFGKTDCEACWFSCRGETQAPLSIERIRQAASIG